MKHPESHEKKFIANVHFSHKCRMYYLCLLLIYAITRITTLYINKNEKKIDMFIQVDTNENNQSIATLLQLANVVR